MGFFTKLPFSDIQVKQLATESIILSGTTNFAGTLKSKGIEIDATFTGLTGSVLTYIGGKIRLAPSSGGGGGDTSFDSNRPTTRSGVPSVNVGGTTVKQFLEGYFFPSVPPNASLGGGSARLFGDNSAFNLSWVATRQTQPITSITVNGVVIPSSQFNTLTQGASASGIQGATIATPNTDQAYYMNVTTASESVNAGTSVNFYHKRFYYGDSQNLISANDAATTVNVNSHENGGESEFATGVGKGAFNIVLSSQFFYYVYPSAFGNASFSINGLANTDFSFKDFQFVNVNGYITNFRLYRSNNILNGTFTIAVS
jgi:hypothetical protein